LPSNNLETDHKENKSRGVYRVFPSGFTISIYVFTHVQAAHFLPKIQGEKWGAAYIRNNFTLHLKKLYS
jgi:hypothetical protein